MTADLSGSLRQPGYSASRNRRMTAAQCALLSLVGGAIVLRHAWRARRAIDLSEKTVVIVGGSRGLGLVIARELASGGAHLVLVARNAEELERARIDLERRGVQAFTCVCDIRNRKEVYDTVERIVAARGTVDVLINDAGIIQVGPLQHLTIEDFENAMATHFWGPLFAILAVMPICDAAARGAS